MNRKPATPLTPTPGDLAGHFRMITAKESPGLLSLQLRCPPTPYLGASRGERSCPPCTPLPPSFCTFVAPLQRSGGPRSGLILGRGVHSHPTVESKGQETGR